MGRMSKIVVLPLSGIKFTPVVPSTEEAWPSKENKSGRYRIVLRCRHCGEELGRTNKTYGRDEVLAQHAKERLPLIAGCEKCGARCSPWLEESRHEMAMLIESAESDTVMEG